MVGASDKGGAARQRVEARQQLGESEWFNQIVVRASLQPLHPVANTAQRRQEQDRRLGSSGPERADQAKAVQARQHPVHHQHVVSAVYGHHQPVLAIGGMIGDMAVLAQATHDVGGGLHIVFDHQHLHPCHPLRISP